MPKIVDHEERRAEIAAAAARVIAERGIDEVTMTGIAEAAGVTTGAVTYYFEDKDEVVLAALYWANGAMRERSARARERCDDVVSIILEALPRDKNSRHEWLVWSVFSDRATRSPTLMKEYRAAYRDWAAFATALLQELQDQGQIDSSIDPAVECELVIALVDGIGLRASRDPKAWPEEKQRRHIQRYLSRLAPRD